MVKIVIKIDGGEAAVTTQGGAEVTTSSQSPEAPGVSVSSELLAAAAVGAQDAGPAPSGAPAASGAVPPPPSATAGLLPHGARPTDLAAGAAPGTRAEPPPSVTTEDGA